MQFMHRIIIPDANVDLSTNELNPLHSAAAAAGGCGVCSRCSNGAESVEAAAPLVAADPPLIACGPERYTPHLTLA